MSVLERLGAAGLPALTRLAWVEVDCDALVANARALADLSRPAELGVVVKADGYGHGLEMAARCAVTGGAGWLCVANLGEAQRLRRAGYAGPVFVLYPVPLDHLTVAADLHLDVSVGSVDQAEAVAERHVGVGVHLEIDTGMTRGGVLPDRATTAAEVVAGSQARLAGVWTHLASPEDPRSTSRQLGLFATVLDELGRAGLAPDHVHALASGGVLTAATAGHSFVRLGLDFYGADPGVGVSLPAGCRPALAVRARPVRVAEVPTGTAVGYGGTWVAERPSVIATLPLGYVDGWSRSSVPGCHALVGGRRAPLVGRVSSDAVTVDVTDIVGVGPESVFTLLGSDGDETITAGEVAEVRETIAWEVLQQLGFRLARVYLAAGEPVAVRPESELTVTGARFGW